MTIEKCPSFQIMLVYFVVSQITLFYCNIFFANGTFTAAATIASNDWMPDFAKSCITMVLVISCGLEVDFFLQVNYKIHVVY